MAIIDRNLREQFLPFRIHKGDGVQTWSFRTSDKADGKIGIVPDDHGKFQEDIGNKQMFSRYETFRENDEYSSVPGSINMDTILNYIPAIQIREYEQDTRLDLVLSLVDFFKQGYKDGSEVAQIIKKSSEFKYLQELVTYDLANIGTSDDWKKILDSFEGIITETCSNGGLYKDKINDLKRKCVIDFCYAMYYRLLDTTTTNVYTLPYNATHILKGNGYAGFDNGFDAMGAALNGFSNKFVDFLAPNLTLTTTPIWKGVTGGEGINLDITFNLFNDTKEKAVRNFIFVNTMLPHNLPSQYAVFQQAPSLYDLKIEGGNRLFMCAGNFECSYKGVMRVPNGSVLKQLVTYSSILESSQKLFEENLIRIPDIYELTLHFKSLLPNNFNNFIFQFALNSKMTNVTREQKGLMSESASTVTKIGDWIKNRATDASKLNTEIEGLREEEEALTEYIDALDDTDTTKAYNEFLRDEVREKINTKVDEKKKFRHKAK